jgi:RNA polymerase sigma factor (sigma-70 family)
MPDERLDLIDRLNAGDPTADDELFTLLYSRLVRLAKLMLGTFPDIRRLHDAESLVHNGWIDLQTALKTVEPENPRRYLGLAVEKVRLVLLDIAKSERRRLDRVPLTPEGANRDDSALGFDPSSGSSSDPGRLEVWTRFHVAVNELEPDELREAFKLHFYSDDKLNRDQIAKLLGLSPRTTSRLIARAKDELAERVMGLKELLS